MKKVLFLALVLQSLSGFAQFKSVDYNNYSAALKVWYGVASPNKVGTVYKSNILSNSFAIYFDDYFKKQSKWVLAKKILYSGSNPSFKRIERVQMSQAPYNDKVIGTYNHLWIYQKADPAKRLLLIQSGTSLGAYYNRSDGKSLKMANTYLEEIEKDLLSTTPYRGRVLEFAKNKISFWQGVDSLNVDWNKFIFNSDEKIQMQQTIDGFLNNYGSADWEKYKLPKNRGVLLYGPPGTGKSFVAKILASNVMKNRYKNKVTYIHVQARHLSYSVYVRQLYDAARILSPSVVFIEDVDLIAGTDRTDRADVKNELMQQLSGVESLKGVITIATTNLAEKIDPALKRSKRLGFHHLVGLPSYDSRVDLFKLYTKKYLVQDLDYGRLSSKTEGKTGADIKEIVQLAVEKSIYDGEVDRGTKNVLLYQRNMELALKGKNKWKN